MLPILLQSIMKCGMCLQDACSFNGAWRGKPAQMARVYYVSSYFWDRASESGIIADKAAIDWKTSPGVSCASRTTTCWCALM
jgi:apyrase